MQTELSKGCPAAEDTIDMASSVIKAVTKVSQQNNRPRIALFTPYIDAVHKTNVDYLMENSIDVITQHNLGFQVDTETTSMSPSSIFEYCKALASSCNDIDVLFIGCSAFRSTGNYG